MPPSGSPSVRRWSPPAWSWPTGSGLRIPRGSSSARSSMSAGTPTTLSRPPFWSRRPPWTPFSTSSSSPTTRVGFPLRDRSRSPVRRAGPSRQARNHAPRRVRARKGAFRAGESGSGGGGAVAPPIPFLHQPHGSTEGRGEGAMKGLVLAGGTATRLFPLTIVTNKHLLPVYDRPMIYYPLETLAGMGIRQVMVVVGKSVGDIVELLADGAHFGLDLTYRYQRGALGIAHAIGLAKDFVGDEAFAVVLGDNVLRGPSLSPLATEFESGPYDAGTLLYRVPDPERFGVAVFDQDGNLRRFEEKPQRPASDLIPIGVYFFRPHVFEVIAGLVPSARGEFEITDVLNHYLARGRLLEI